jgi:hypothetical protein
MSFTLNCDAKMVGGSKGHPGVDRVCTEGQILLVFKDAEKTRAPTVDPAGWPGPAVESP